MRVANDDIARLIVDESLAQGVEPEVALAFAIAESNVRNIPGDVQLFERPGYIEKVRRMWPGLEHVPDRDWISYGPFQLQALWHMRPGETPRRLLELETNIPRGVRLISRLLNQWGDDEQARLAYVCGSPAGCKSAARREQILSRYRDAKQVAAAYLDSENLYEDEPPKSVLLAGALFAVAVWEILKARD